MADQWRRTNIKFSILKHLHVSLFPTWAFKIPDKDGNLDVVSSSVNKTQFLMAYPGGQFLRPSIACVHTGMRAPGRLPSVGYRSEDLQYVVLVYAKLWSDVERYTDLVRDKLDSERIGLYRWDPASKTFVAPVTETVQVRYETDVLLSLTRKDPESRITVAIYS